MEWWIWTSVGLFLLGLEMFTPTGMYLLIIGLSLMIVGGLTSIGAIESLQLQCLLAAVTTMIFVLTIRRPLASILKGLTKQTASGITSQTVTIVEDIAVGSIGKGELSGSTWTVRNNSKASLIAGARHAVSKVDGITLVIE